MKQKMDEPFQNQEPSDARAEDARGLRVLRLIEHLASASQPMTLSQLAFRMQIPKATMMRTLDNLERHGYVLRTPVDRGYIPGAAATSLAVTALRNNAFIRACRATLGKLVGLTGETCNVTMQEGNVVVYVDRVETDEPLRLHLLPGTRAPIHCTASGKLFLSRLTLLEQRRLLSMMPLKRLTPKTITDPALLEAELHRIAKRGIGIDDQEFVLGMVAIAVPICAADGRILAAVACHAPVARKSVDQLMDYIPKLEEAGLKLRPVLAT
ncbi:IclR family transcriptional regulator [Noviherbaspirillum saxi]|uniref:IclR family transcriptional regulator n=2 Tax=Noviherbaspirillum saxi TaxID=2320863 RepID=A0A3A3FKC7_9BURK|nr:IclR family transcriptional regulator [Noviherbaspirillum saxi]